MNICQASPFISRGLQINGNLEAGTNILNVYSLLQIISLSIYENEYPGMVFMTDII